MVDAGKRGEVWGDIAPGQPIERPDQVRGRIAKHIRRYGRWADIDGTLCLNYERVAFGSIGVARQVARHMTVRPSPLLDVLRAKARSTYLSSGRSRRFRADMDAEMATRWYDDFADFIDRHCQDRPTWAQRQVGRAGIIWTRLGRQVNGRRRAGGEDTGQDS